MVKVGQGGPRDNVGRGTHLDSVGPASADELAAWAKEGQRSMVGPRREGGSPKINRGEATSFLS